ncbi:MAG TPA: DUF3352 domain-containing protein, partial [Capillimicrobium sp.]
TESELEKITGKQDIGAEIERLLNESGEGDDITYANDIEPWLGESLSAFVTGVSGTEPDGAVVVQSTDDDAASEAIAKGEGEERTYEEVTYWVDGETARGVTDGFVIFGSERGFRTVVDTLKGDDVETIEDSAQFTEAVDAAGGSDDALGLVYFDTQGLLDAFARSGGIPQDQLAQVREQLESTGGEAGVAKLGVDENVISIEGATLGVAEQGDAVGDAAAAVAALPGDSWLALGIGAIGERGRQGLEQLNTLGAASGQDIDQLLAQVEAQTGINVEQDLLSWMGDGGLFVQGTGIADIGGALVVQTSDPQATSQAIVKVSELIRQQSPGTELRQLDGVAGADEGVVIATAGSPVELIMATAGDKFVAGINRAAVESAIDPQTTLADSDSFSAAADALGDGIEPTFFFDVAPTLQLAEGLGASDDPNYAEVRDYLANFGSVAAGSSRDGDTAHGKLVITLK